MKTLFLIPARGGSKGIPRKNIKLLRGKPLIQYAIENALEVAETKNDICISTDDDEIISVAESTGITVPFKRPEELAQDGSGTYEVILHALDFYKAQGKEYDTVVLLQPTSPFRTAQHIREAMHLYREDCDMVVSVHESPSNPYYVMYRENKDGFLQKLLPERFTRRQDCPKVYEYNGAIYIMRVSSLRKKPLHTFTHCVKYVMPLKASIDLDTPDDWEYCEYLMEKRQKRSN